MRVKALQSFNNSKKSYLVLFLVAQLLTSITHAAKVPKIDSRYSPIAVENRENLKKRLVESFDYRYSRMKYKTLNKDLSKSIEFYYLHRELQALVDMWHVTDNKAYLIKARKLSFKAMLDATQKPRALLWQGKSVGVFPCFYVDMMKRTGGHGQLWDLQGGSGLCLVASALKMAELEGWKTIADFVQSNIIEKWLFRNPAFKNSSQDIINNGVIVLKTIEAARDKREHFASICIDMDKLGYAKYPYRRWAKLLSDIYLGIKPNLNARFTKIKGISEYIPTDWGTIVVPETNGLIWYWNYKWPNNSPPISCIMDTSHANRTAWLACRAFDEGFVDKNHIERFVNTMKKQIWQKDKQGFYFTNYINGNDPLLKGKKPGQLGSIWFGFHRLAAYDVELRDLFISIAYDITNGGPNIADGTLNKSKRMAPMCLMAWGARLIKEYDKGITFP